MTPRIRIIGDDRATAGYLLDVENMVRTIGHHPRGSRGRREPTPVAREVEVPDRMPEDLDRNATAAELPAGTSGWMRNDRSVSCSRGAQDHSSENDSLHVRPPRGCNVKEVFGAASN